MKKGIIITIVIVIIAVVAIVIYKKKKAAAEENFIGRGGAVKFGASKPSVSYWDTHGCTGKIKNDVCVGGHITNTPN